MTDLRDTTFEQVAGLLINCFKTGGKLLLCGNGGSSADCAHITGELVKGFCKKSWSTRSRSWPTAAPATC